MKTGTCIVGMEHEGKVYMGGDSAAVSSSGGFIVPTSVPKVFIKNGVLFGYTCSFRMGQLLQHTLEIPTLPNQKDEYNVYSYLCSYFVHAVRLCFERGGWLKVRDNEVTSGDFLVGLGGQLYRVGPEFEVTRCTYGIDAIGCGAQYALGALHVLSIRIKCSPEMKLKRALEAAATFSPQVCEPFLFCSL